MKSCVDRFTGGVAHNMRRGYPLALHARTRLRFVKEAMVKLGTALKSRTGLRSVRDFNRFPFFGRLWAKIRHVVYRRHNRRNVQRDRCSARQQKVAVRCPLLFKFSKIFFAELARSSTSPTARREVSEAGVDSADGANPSAGRSKRIVSRSEKASCPTLR